MSTVGASPVTVSVSCAINNQFGVHGDRGRAVSSMFSRLTVVKPGSAR
jgi:hypothetical protein